MTSTPSRGFTLVELLLALLIGLLVSGAAYRLLSSSRQAAHAQAEQIGLQDNVRSGLWFLGNELREIGYSEVTPEATAALGLPTAAVSYPDLIAIGPDSLTYRAMRAIGFTCSLDDATGEVVVRSSTYHARRAPTSSDSALLYVENQGATAADDAWLAAGIAAGPVATGCPDGEAGIRIRVAFPSSPPGLTAAVVFPKMSVGGPIRVYEVVQIRSYRSNGEVWLGLRSLSAGGTLQPVVGPLSGGVGAQPGLQLAYRDAGDNLTAAPDAVRGIEITLVGLTATPVRGWGSGPVAMDSLALSTRVSLRNTIRP